MKPVGVTTAYGGAGLAGLTVLTTVCGWLKLPITADQAGAFVVLAGIGLHALCLYLGKFNTAPVPSEPPQSKIVLTP